MMANYKGYARSSGFRPEQVAQGLEQIDRQTARMVAALKDERDAAIAGREEYSRGMQRAATIESQQLQRDSDIAVQNQKIKFDTATQDRDRALQVYNQESQAARQIFGTFAKLSETAAVNLQKIEREGYIKQWTEELYDVIAKGENHEKVKQFRAFQAQQSINITEATGATQKAVLQGARPVDVVSALKNFQDLSPGVQMGIMYLSKGRWGSFIRSYDKPIKRYENGKLVETFKADEAGRDPERQRAVINQLMPEFLTSEGYLEVNPAMLWRSGLLPAMIKDNEILLAEAEKNFLEDKTSQIKETAAQAILAAGMSEDPNVLAKTYGEQRALLVSILGQSGANEFLDGVVINSIDANGNPIVDFEKYRTAVEGQGPNGEGMSLSRQARLAQTARKLARQQQRDAREDTENDAYLYVQENYDTLTQQLEQASSANEKASIIKSFNEALSEAVPGYVGTHPKIDQLERSVVREAEEAEMRSAQDLITARAVEPQHIAAAQNPRVKEALQKAYLEQNTRQFGQEFKSVKAGLKALVKEAMDLDPNVEGLDPVGQSALIQLESEFANRVQALVASGVSESVAAQRVGAELKQEMTENKPTSKFYHTTDEATNSVVFPKLQKIIDDSANRERATIRNIQTLASNGDVAGVYRTLNSYITPSQLRQYSTQAVAGVAIQYPAVIVEAAKRTGTQESAVLNRLLRNNGLPGFQSNAVPRIESNEAFKRQYRNPERRSEMGALRLAVESGPNNQGAVNNPTNVRWNVRQLVTGNPAAQTYPGVNILENGIPAVVYDPVGHGGGKYHDHFEFGSVEERQRFESLLARIIDPYTGAPYRITSTLRVGDPRAHGRGTAIDVAPPLNLPPEKEQEWSETLYRLVGIDPRQIR